MENRYEHTFGTTMHYPLYKWKSGFRFNVTAQGISNCIQLHFSQKWIALYSSLDENYE